MLALNFHFFFFSDIHLLSLSLMREREREREGTKLKKNYTGHMSIKLDLIFISTMKLVLYA